MEVTSPVDCPRCGRRNTPESRFCRFCGRALPRHALSRLAVRFWPGRRPRSSTPSSNTRRRLRWDRLAILTGAAVLAALMIDLGSSVWAAATHLPSVTNLVSILDNGRQSVVYDLNGKPVAVLHGTVDRKIVPLKKIAPVMQQAIVAIEDHNFYHNPGFDLRSILRAIVVDIIHGAPVQGASTITEQLAKDLYLGDQKTLTRKLQEFLIGLELAHRYSKQDILAMYLNEVYYGNGANGIYAAAKSYFDRPPSALSLAQAAMLAGLPQAPSLYDPLVHFKLAKARQWQVLQAMVRYGDITSQAAQKAYSARLHFHPGAYRASSRLYPYPWYIDQVIRVLRSRGYSMNDIMDGGLKIYTALRPKVYTIAQNAVNQWMDKNFGPSARPIPDHEAAAVVEDPHTGHIWAIIGGRRHHDLLQFDPATMAVRSTGSAIKPLLVYTEALVRGYTEMSVIQDVPIFSHVHGQAWWPTNDDHYYRGYLDLRDALAISDNNVAVHLLNHLGIGYATTFANQKFGLGITPRQAHQGLGIALGVVSNPLIMTQAYATFANQGVRMHPIFITKVENAQGHVLFRDSPHGTRVVSPQIAYIMDKMLERVLTPHPLSGIGPQALPTGYDLGIGRPAAGKTGTNNNEEDAWFIGFEPQAAVGIWEGNLAAETPQPFTLSGRGPAYGDVAAGPIWQTIMTGINHALNFPIKHFPRPAGVIYVPGISITSGKLASPYAPAQDVQGGWFVAGTQPTTQGDSHFPVKVPADHPDRLWQPGCGPYIVSDFLRPESDWHSGVPKPWDAIYWPPTAPCTAGLPQTPSHGKIKTPHVSGKRKHFFGP